MHVAFTFHDSAMTIEEYLKSITEFLLKMASNSEQSTVYPYEPAKIIWTPKYSKPL
ncbi:MAG: hypothetical protein QXT86_14090 [Archaeoglobaceae archaeon]